MEILNFLNGDWFNPFSVVLLPISGNRLLVYLCVVNFIFKTAKFETANPADDCYKILEFSTSDSRKCHNYSITDDNVCELNTKRSLFTVALSIISTMGTQVQLYSNLLNTTIFIDDSEEPECCKCTCLCCMHHSPLEAEKQDLVSLYFISLCCYYTV